MATISSQHIHGGPEATSQIETMHGRIGVQHEWAYDSLVTNRLAYETS
jgi:hypothetical protein